MKGRDFTSIGDLGPEELRDLLDSALRLKREGFNSNKPLAGKVLALIFQKPSLRTRVSFDVAMEQLGGHAIYLGPEEVRLGKREGIADVARTLSRYVDGIVARTFSHQDILELAEYASVPVINGLSDMSHPCQALADLMTILEKNGSLEGLTLAYIGDGGNNVAHSLLLGCAAMGVNMRIACPPEHVPEASYLEKAQSLSVRKGNQITVGPDPFAAVKGAQIIYTDVWTSMGQEHESEIRKERLRGYQVNPELLSNAPPDTMVMHPLPARRGEEIADGVIDGPNSVVFDQAENRLHSQKALLLLLLGQGR